MKEKNETKEIMPYLNIEDICFLGGTISFVS
jgi:hypothetical protein